MESYKTWLTDDLWNKIDQQVAAFTFSQGEKYLEELCRISAAIARRSYTLLGIIVAICPILITAMLTIDHPIFVMAAYLFAAVLIGFCIILGGLVKPRDGRCPGRSPKDLLRLSDLEHYENEEYKSFIKYELENLQDKIEFTEKATQERTVKYRLVLCTLVTCFFLLLLLPIICITVIKV